VDRARDRTTRRFAFIHGGAAGRTRHLVGLPVEPSGGGVDRRPTLPHAVIVFMVPDGDAVFLIRHASDGAFAGDTWHPTIEEAIEQAALEFALDRDAWQVVPPSVTDLEGFARAVIAGWTGLEPPPGS
jgi:hypothetical protein